MFEAYAKAEKHEDKVLAKMASLLMCLKPILRLQKHEGEALHKKASLLK